MLLLKDRDHLLFRYKAISNLYAFYVLSITLIMAIRELRIYYLETPGPDLTIFQVISPYVIWLLLILTIPITGLFMKSIKAKIYTKSLITVVPTIYSIYLGLFLPNFQAVTNLCVLYAALILTLLGFYRFSQLFLLLVYFGEIYFFIYQGILPPPSEWAFNPDGNIVFYFDNIPVKQIPYFIAIRYFIPLLLALSLTLSLKIFINTIEENFIALESDAGKVIEEASVDPSTGFRRRADLESSYRDLKLTAENENLDLVFLMHTVGNISSIKNIHGFEAAEVCMKQVANELRAKVNWQGRFFSLGGGAYISAHIVYRNSSEFKEYLKALGRTKLFQYNDIRVSFQILTGAYISKIEEPLTMIIAKADAARIVASKDNDAVFREMADVRNFGSSLEDNIYIDVDGSTPINKVQGEYDPQRLKDAVLNNEIEFYGAPIINVPSRTLAGIQAKFAWIDNAGNKVPFDAFEKTLSQIQWEEPYFEVLTKKGSKFMDDCRNTLYNIPIFFKINPFYASSVLSPSSSLTKSIAALGESADIQDLENVILQIPYYLTPTFTENLNTINKKGPRLALENFGSRESFQALKDHQFSFIALAPQFCKDIYKNPEVQDLAKAIVGFSQKLNIEIIAQGITDKETAKTLEGIGITKQQGPYWSPDLPIGELKSLSRSLEQLFSYSN